MKCTPTLRESMHIKTRKRTQYCFCCALYPNLVQWARLLMNLRLAFNRSTKTNLSQGKRMTEPNDSIRPAIDFFCLGMPDTYLPAFLLLNSKTCQIRQKLHGDYQVMFRQIQLYLTHHAYASRNAPASSGTISVGLTQWNLYASQMLLRWISI